MSQFTDVHNALAARIQAVLPDHQQLPNPYEPDENDSNILYKGWGIQITGANNGERFVSCEKLSVIEQFTVVVTRDFIARENDVTTKTDTALALREDLQLIIDDVDSDYTLGSTAVTRSNWVSHNGVEYTVVDRNNFLQILALFEVEYIRNL